MCEVLAFFFHFLSDFFGAKFIIVFSELVDRPEPFYITIKNVINILSIGHSSKSNRSIFFSILISCEVWFCHTLFVPYETLL